MSRQAFYDRLAPATYAVGQVVEESAELRLVPPVLPTEWETIPRGPKECAVDVAIHVLALRHPAAGHRKITARLRRSGYVLNHEKTERLLKAWGLLRSGKEPQPKAQGKRFDITASNQLRQTDMTSIWCDERGWEYLTAVIDSFDRACWAGRSPCAAEPQRRRPEGHGASRQRHPVPACALPGIAKSLDLVLSGTAYRHPDGNAFIERNFPQSERRSDLDQRVRHLRPSPQSDRHLDGRPQQRPPTCFNRRTDPCRGSTTQISGLTVNHDGGLYGMDPS